MLNSAGPELLSFANQYHKAKKMVEARAFYQFHRCQHRCLDGNRSREALDVCREQCEVTLDQFYEYKRRTKLGEKVMFAGERGDAHEWERTCGRVQSEQQSRLAKLSAWLDQRDGRR